MMKSLLVNELQGRCLPDGGFSAVPEGRYRPDATCWAILALEGESTCRDLIDMARFQLTKDQLSDGRVCLSSNHPETVWITALAILAWHRSPEYQDNQKKATEFLMSNSGAHFERTKDLPVTIDCDIKGWPWIQNTSSWVEPTALATMALKLAGFGDNARVKEGTRLILDRQLPDGGWNYGNTVVFEQKLRPMPISTGIALNAIIGQSLKETIQQSIQYLQSRIESLTTPLSLGWSLLGLGAWQARPENAHLLINACLMNQARYGKYDTASLSLLQVALRSASGLEGIFSDEEAG